MGRVLYAVYMAFRGALGGWVPGKLCVFAALYGVTVEVYWLGRASAVALGQKASLSNSSTVGRVLQHGSNRV